MCNNPQTKISLYYMKYDGVSSLNTVTYSIRILNCPIRDLDAFSLEHRWINQIKNSQKQEGIIELESKEELLSFLEISFNSTTILKVKRNSSLSPLSESWDFYLVGLNLPVCNLEKYINYLYKFSRLKYLQKVLYRCVAY